MSSTGDGVTLAAMPLLATTITRDPTQVAAVTFATTLPWLFFALVGGAVADRLDRRYVMGTVDIIRMLLMATLAFVVLAGAQRLWILLAIAFLLGTAQCFFDTSAQSIVPNVVASEDLEWANGRLYAAEVVANQFTGPPLGSFLFAAAAAAPFFLDATSFAIAALLVLTLRGSFRAARSPSIPATTMRRDIGDAIRWLWHHRLLRTLAALLGMWNLVATAGESILVLFALERLHLHKTGFGLLLAAGAMGALAGTLFAERIIRRLGDGRTLLAAIATWGATDVGIGLSHNAIAVGVFLALGSSLAMTWNIITVSLRQAIIPNDLLGRVNSAYRLVAWGTMPIGAMAGGVLAHTFNLATPFFVGAGIMGVMFVVARTRLSQRIIDAARAAAT